MMDIPLHQGYTQAYRQQGKHAHSVNAVLAVDKTVMMLSWQHETRVMFVSQSLFDV